MPGPYKPDTPFISYGGVTTSNAGTPGGDPMSVGLSYVNFSSVRYLGQLRLISPKTKIKESRHGIDPTAELETLPI